MIKERRTKQNKKIKKILLTISILIAVLFLSIFLLITYFYNKYDLDVDTLTSVNNGVVIYSSTGKESTLYNTNRSIVKLDSLPDYVPKAFIDVEDKHFYSHNGYDLKRIIKAGLVNITTRSKSQGASTISQQLIKNALLSNEKTYQRKLEEIVLSVKMEKEFSKDEILAMYLNTIYFGANAYGIENASRIYFDKPAKDLTINEACCLAGIIKSPARYSPILNYDNAIARRNFVAKTMLDCKDINESEYEDIISQPIITIKNNESNHSYEKEAILEACSLLNISERELINKEYQIITNKDDLLQEIVMNANNDVIEESAYLSNNLDSVSILVSNTGEVKAYYVNSNYDIHNMKRQPASTLKPLAVYLPCLIHNILQPASQILDEEINYNGYSPKNADNKFHGYVSARDALKYSYNIPAVKLLDTVGLKNSREILSRLGIYLDNSDMNMSLALGSTYRGISLMQLVSAYNIIANGGIYRPISFVDKILDKDGNIIYKEEDFQERIIDEADAFILTDMLKDVAKSGTARRLNSLNIPVASKTGTATNGTNNTDLYNISYTTDYTTLTWVANIKDNALPDGLYSSAQPTEITKRILSCIYKDNKPNDFIKPNSVEKFAYDLNELEKNHRVVAPNHDIDRYIAYDYFKLDNKPIVIDSAENIELEVSIDRKSAKLTFNADKYKKYYIYKQIKDSTSLLGTVKDNVGTIEIEDKDIYNYDEISYYIIEGENCSNNVVIRPKDYLINLLNNEFLSGKKRWLV